MEVKIEIPQTYSEKINIYISIETTIKILNSWLITSKFQKKLTYIIIVYRKYLLRRNYDSSNYLSIMMNFKIFNTSSKHEQIMLFITCSTRLKLFDFF